MPRFQFSLRTLLIAVTLLAVLCGYVVQERRIAILRASLVQEIYQQEGHVFAPSKSCFGFGVPVVQSINLPPSSNLEGRCRELFPDAEITRDDD